MNNLVSFWLPVFLRKGNFLAYFAALLLSDKRRVERKAT
tara:strand:+ start:16419 stop:16535 length:117 start_codon:yes stop_codon:yes gene_type:complete